MRTRTRRAVLAAAVLAAGAMVLAACTTATTTSSGTTTTTTTTTQPSASYVEQPGYPAIQNTGTTLGVTTVAAGDVMMMMAHTAPSRGSSHVTSVTDSAGRVAWQASKATGFTNHPSGDTLEIWYGVVKSAGATTIDVHWSGTTFDHFVWAAEWRSSLGPSVTWSAVAAGVENAALCTGRTCDDPTLGSPKATGLYWGWSYPASTGQAGTTAGVTYDVTTEPTHGNVLAWDPSVAAGTAVTPAFGQVTATSWYDAVAVVMVATA
ncbi:MAG: hypothetical protein ACRDZR_07535 [Acidimicrobiales bacterium]